MSPSIAEDVQPLTSSARPGSLRSLARRRPVLVKAIVISLGLCALLGSIVAININAIFSANVFPTSVTLEDNGRFLNLSAEGVETSSGGFGVPFLAGAVMKRPHCSFLLAEDDDEPASEFAILTAEEDDALGLGAGR